MPRRARFVLVGTLRHVISRFVDRDWYFTSDDERGYYLTLFGRAMQHTDWSCIGYCLMSNHLHFAMIAGKQSLESWSKRVNSPFANWLNQQRGRLGPIFADRPSCSEVPRHRAIDLIAYIHNNPVRAGVVTEATASTWSSHNAYIGVTAAPRWLDVAGGLRHCGLSENRTAFHAAVLQRVDSRAAYPELEEPRDLLDTQGQPLVIPAARVVSRFAPEHVLLSLSEILEVPIGHLRQRHARGETSEAKQVAVHAARATGLSLADVAAALNVSRQRASQIASMPLSDEQQRLVAAVIRRLHTSAA